MMSQFLAAMYHITREGRHVAEGQFRTADEVFDCVRCQRAGVYRIHRHDPPGRVPGGLIVWGDVAHFGAGKIAFDPGPVPS
jgi:hypothetical protein